MYRITNNLNLKSKTTIILIFLLLFIASSILAQDTRVRTYNPINWTNNTTRDILWEYWYNPFYADGYNVKPHMAICQDGSFAVTGYYIIEDGTGGYEEWFGYVLKTDSEGNFLWADKDTLSFMGWNESRAIVETSDGCIINGGECYMIKRDFNGNRIWHMQTDFAIYSMINDDNNTIVLTGISDGSLAFRKIDEDGNEIWNQDIEIGEYATVGKCLIKTSDGGYAIIGYVLDEFIIGAADILVIKTDALGDTLWTYRYDHVSESDHGNWILENSNNELLIVGEVAIPGSVRGYYAKFNLDGELLTEEILDPDNGYNCWYAIDLPEENAYLVTAVPNIIKFDYDFNIVWVEYMDTLLNYYHKLSDGYIFYSNGVHLMRTDENIVSVSENIIHKLKCELSVFPNPFNPETTISYSLNTNSKLILEIYNIKGQKVKTLINDFVEAGYHEIIWDGKDKKNKSVASGIYFYRLVTDSYQKTKKMLLLK
ncbi:MAG: T9SS type A sorting domain-containing protein [Candidatus Cloacimonetes bacterium]|nr:T9SS type A sorting domain-containing protein [Candidatus Cloacimonadota bacterium]